jgi:hypothetical protein
MPPNDPNAKTDLDASKPAAPPAGPIDPKSLLLPKKEGGPSVDSAQRVDAAKLFAQEAKAKVEPLETPIGEVSTPHAPPPPPPKEESVVKALQTYGGDINTVVREGKVSATSIAAAEAERRARATTGEPVAPQDIAPAEAPSPMRWVFIIGGGALIVGGAALAATLFMRPGPVPVRGTGGQAPFVEVDDTAIVRTSAGEGRDQLVTALEATREAVNLSVGLAEWVYVAAPTSTAATPDPLPIDQLLGILAPDIPQDLVRALAPQYLLGVHSYDQNQTFLIMRVDSYQGAYAGMLAWEPTMRVDLMPLFSRTPPARIAGQGGGTSQTAAPSFLATGFVDRVVDNHDARVVADQSGDILLLWTFLDRNTLVITTNEYTLNEVIRRLNTANLVPLPQ